MLLFFLELLFVAPAPATAGEFRAEEKTTTIDGTVDDDLYLASDTLRVTGTVNGDMAAVARRIDVSGAIAGSTSLAAQDIAVDGSVERAARLAGKGIEIDGKVGRDVIVFGQTVRIGKTASVGRDLVAFAQDVKIEGSVGGRLRGGADTMLIDSEITGDVDVDATELELGPNARIGGNLTYGSERRVVMDDAAVVSGEVTHKPPRSQGRPGPAEVVFGQIRSMIGPMLLGLLLLWLLPPFVPGVASTMRTANAASLLTGVAALVLVPVVAAVLFFIFTVLGGGWSIPGTMLGAYGAALALSRVMAGYALGRIILERTKNSTENPLFGQRFAALALGVVVLTILSAIPLIGVFAAFLPVVLTLGALVVFLVRWRDRMKVEKESPVMPPGPPDVPAAA